MISIEAISGGLRDLVTSATLAPSLRNTQPWKFAIGVNDFRIIPDYSRRLPIADPEDRELWISLGCALENLLTAAKREGLTGEVVYSGPEDYITVRLRPSFFRGPDGLAASILAECKSSLPQRPFKLVKVNSWV